MSIPSPGTLGPIIDKVVKRGVLPHALLDYARFHVFELPKLEADSLIELPGRFEALDASGLLDVAACREMADPEAGAAGLRSRFEHECIAVGYYEGDRMLAYAWARQGGNEMEDRDRFELVLGPKGAYCFDVFIHPDARGRGLFPCMIHARQQILAERGVEHWYSTVDAANTASLKAHAKLGAPLIETITFWSFAGMTRHVSTGSPAGRYAQWGCSKNFVSQVLTPATMTRSS